MQDLEEVLLLVGGDDCCAAAGRGRRDLRARATSCRGASRQDGPPVGVSGDDCLTGPSSRASRAPGPVPETEQV